MGWRSLTLPIGIQVYKPSKPFLAPTGAQGSVLRLRPKRAGPGETGGTHRERPPNPDHGTGRVTYIYHQHLTSQVTCDSESAAFQPETWQEETVLVFTAWIKKPTQCGSLFQLRMVWLSTDAVAPSRDVTSPGWVSPVEVPGHSGAPAGRSFRPTPVLRSPVRGVGGKNWRQPERSQPSRWWA